MSREPQNHNLKSLLSDLSGLDGTSDFDLNKDLYSKGRVLRDASVLVPLQFVAGEWTVILTKRSSQLKHHPGQIAFPGGKVDETDANSLDAALRESHEEIGLPPQSVEIITALPTHETVTSFLVTPHVGIVEDGFKPIPEQGEVAEVFNVPLFHFQDREKFQIHHRKWQGIDRRYYAVPYGPYYIWGATARMMLMLCQICEAQNAD